MSTNPFVNALAATAYITALVSVVFNAPKTSVFDNSIMAPILFLSVFVLSAALMGYFFLYQPLRFLFENKPQEATKLFLMTVAVFAGITGAVFVAWLLLSAWL